MPSNATVSTPLGRVTPLAFPGRIIKVGDRDSAIVAAIQHRLNQLGCGPVEETGIFDAEKTKKAVKLFQARFPDVNGLPLTMDGKVGFYYMECYVWYWFRSIKRFTSVYIS